MELERELPRRLGLLDSIAIVVGIVIGGGIFVVPNLVARSLPSESWIMLCWAFAGVISFFGALACADNRAILRPEHHACARRHLPVRSNRHFRAAGYLKDA